MLAAFPGLQLPVLTEWVKNFAVAPDPQDQLAALRRAELKARADIRAVLERLACEFDVLSHEVDEAMTSVNETLGDLTSEIERDITHEIEQAEQW